MSSSPEAPRARTIPLPARGGAMAALEFGPAGRPVDIVFSHANGFNALTYRTILAPLAADLRILAIDLRGHGASTLPTAIVFAGASASPRSNATARSRRFPASTANCCCSTAAASSSTSTMRRRCA